MCESFWDECDDSIFSQLCDVDLKEKLDSNEDVKENEDKKIDNSIQLKKTEDKIDNSFQLKNPESTSKRKYCATESNVLCSEMLNDRKKTMIKKLKSNSLFKL